MARLIRRALVLPDGAPLRVSLDELRLIATRVPFYRLFMGHPVEVR